MVDVVEKKKVDINQLRAEIRVLIVDDNETFLKVAISFLLRFSEISHVETARSARAALDLITSNPPDLVLLDLDMPDMNGLEAIPHIRSLAPELPVVMLSIMDSNVYQEAALKMGANAYVSKSSMGKDLIPTLRGILNL